MIQINRNPTAVHQDIRIKIVGLGGAGGNVLDRLLLDGSRDAELIRDHLEGGLARGAARDHDVLGAPADYARTPVSSGRNLSDFRLIPPPMMNRLGETSASTWVR